MKIEQGTLFEAIQSNFPSMTGASVGHIVRVVLPLLNEDPKPPEKGYACHPYIRQDIKPEPMPMYRETDKGWQKYDEESKTWAYQNPPGPCPTPRCNGECRHGTPYAVFDSVGTARVTPLLCEPPHQCPGESGQGWCWECNKPTHEREPREKPKAPADVPTDDPGDPWAIPYDVTSPWFDGGPPTTEEGPLSGAPWTYSDNPAGVIFDMNSEKRCASMLTEARDWMVTHTKPSGHWKGGWWAIERVPGWVLDALPSLPEITVCDLMRWDVDRLERGMER